MVDAQAVVLLPGPGLIIPEGIAPGFRMTGPEGVDVSQMKNGPKGAAAFRAAQRVVLPGCRVIDVVVRRAGGKFLFREVANPLVFETMMPSD